MGGQRRPTLGLYIQALEGSKIMVELRRDTLVKGTLASADEHMNLHLTDASVTVVDGTRRTMASIHLRGSAICYIHVPGNLEPSAALDAHRRRTEGVKRQHAMSQGGAAKLPKGEHVE